MFKVSFRAFCSRNNLINFTVYDYNLTKVSIKAFPFTSLFESLRINGINVESECSKQMQCGLCHCILSPDIIESEKYIPANETEADVSHILSPYTEYSRFSCQTVINEAFEGKTIYLINKDSLNNITNLIQ